MKKLFIIKCGSTFEFIKNSLNDFEDWVIEKLDKNIDISIIDIQRGNSLPTLRKDDVVILTGSHSMVTDNELWSLKAQKWILDIIKNENPILAICYGHQLLARSLGGVVDYHKDGIELGTVEIFLDNNAKNDKLFSKFQENFKAHTVHSQTVEVLPENAVRLAYNKHDKNHAYRVGSCAYSVQFHPEFDEDIMNLYIKKVGIEKNFSDEETEKLLRKTENTVIATSILKEFGKIYL